MTFLAVPPSSLDRAAFMAHYGGIYEYNPWIAAAVFDSGSVPDTVEGLSDALRAVVDAAPEEARLTLLRAHPDLAGKLATAGALTAESQAEQMSAGLDRCTEQEFAAFQQLNAAYTARFGFPFIIAVRGMTRGTILERFAQRLGNARAAEMQEALEQVHRIARLRLMALALPQARPSALEP